jgi:hypothetical protein
LEQTVVDQKDSEAVLLITILQEPNAGKARKRYIEVLGLEGIDDQRVYELVEARVFDAIIRRTPVVEIERDLAQAMLLVLKKGIKKSKGAQPSTRVERRRKHTLVAIGRRIKAELMAGGMNATQAALQAAEEAADEGKRYGLDYSPGYLKREMEKPDD